MRLFFAVPLSPVLRGEAVRAAETLRAGMPGKGVTWSRPETMHVTLAFLGDVNEAYLPEVEAAGRDAAAMAPFELRLGSMGRFPERGPVRVLWVGFQTGAEELAELHGRLRRALAVRGMELEARSFSAHVTLGRVRTGMRVPWPAVPQAGTSGSCQRVEDFHLMQSELAAAGARHRSRVAFPLTRDSRVR